MFDKILIANRGEIAVRIIKTAKRLGIRTVALYSTIDQKAQHVLLADEAYCLKAAASIDSYLAKQKIIDIAKRAHAQAIHPGYGFLAENAEFARLCKEHGLVFIGPSVANIEAMGSKQTAKKLLEKAQVPLIPGYHGSCQKPETLLKQAREIGFPVLLKAALGGGGKGMRIVSDEKEFAESLNSAKREALASFDDDTLLIEKYIDNPRHVEVQVFADHHGNAVHLFERDCSIQRRHQKIIEEAPAPLLSDSLRQRLSQAALSVVKTIDYIGAGTIEFLVSDEACYFMEMNTRLQVEHPVTELITNTDLVEWQLRIANNETLPLSQRQLNAHGHAIEVRIYAEDPDNNFLPSIGKITALKYPKTNDRLRIDSGVIQGDCISQYYDPMIAKLIVHAEDRATAINRLQQALIECQIQGIHNNIAYLLSIISTPAFKKARLNTHFLQQYQLASLPELPIPAPVIAACYDNLLEQANIQNPLLQECYAWQSMLAQHIERDYLINQKAETVSILYQEKNRLQIYYQTQEYRLDFWLSETNLFLEFEGQQHRVSILNQDSCFIINYHGNCISVERADNKWRDASNSTEQGQLTAPMPGTVVAILAKPGQTVNAGDNLIVIEAMKMEHTISAPTQGVVGSVYYQIGDQVNEGDELVSIEAEYDASEQS